MGWEREHCINKGRGRQIGPEQRGFLDEMETSMVAAVCTMESDIALYVFRPASSASRPREPNSNERFKI